MRQFRFSPDGKLLAGANWDDVRVWSFPEGKLQHDFSKVVQSNCIGFSADGGKLVVLRQKEMEICTFDLFNGKLIKTTKLANVEKEQGATTYTFFDNGRWLCTFEVYGNVTVWDTATGNRQFRQKIFQGSCRISNADVLTLWDNAWMDRYKIQTGEQLSHKLLYGKLDGAVANPQGTRFAGYSPEEQAIVFWDSVSDRQVGGKIPIERREWESAERALSADSQRFVYTSNGKSLDDRQVCVADVDTQGRRSANSLLQMFISSNSRSSRPTVAMFFSRAAGPFSARSTRPMAESSMTFRTIYAPSNAYRLLPMVGHFWSEVAISAKHGALRLRNPRHSSSNGTTIRILWPLITTARSCRGSRMAESGSKTSNRAKSSGKLSRENICPLFSWRPTANRLSESFPM